MCFPVGDARKMCLWCCLDTTETVFTTTWAFLSKSQRLKLFATIYCSVKAFTTFGSHKNEPQNSILSSGFALFFPFDRKVKSSWVYCWVIRKCNSILVIIISDYHNQMNSMKRHAPPIILPRLRFYVSICQRRAGGEYEKTCCHDYCILNIHIHHVYRSFPSTLLLLKYFIIAAFPSLFKP